MISSHLLPRAELLLLGLVLSLGCVVGRAEATPAGHVMQGTPHQTAYYVSQGGPGPTVFIIGGCHGDEPAGFLAADKMVNWKMTTGTLVLIPHAHVSAIDRKTRGYPGNMNRMFPGKADGDKMQQLAFQTWSLIKQYQPDLLVTLHESRGFHSEEPTAFGQTLTYDFQALRAQFDPLIVQANKQIKNKAHHFSTYIYPVETCPTYCAYKLLGIPSTSIETCKKLQLETRIQYQLLMSRVLMKSAGLQWEEPGQKKPPTNQAGGVKPVGPVAPKPKATKLPPAVTPTALNHTAIAVAPPPVTPAPSRRREQLRLTMIAVCAFLAGIFTQAAVTSVLASQKRARRRARAAALPE